MTSEVTKRGLWFGFNGGGEPDGTYCTMKTGDPNEQFWVPYDTTLALVAEAYEDAADEADEWLADSVPKTAAKVRERIRALIPTDALAAREARDRKVREAELRLAYYHLRGTAPEETTKPEYERGVAVGYRMALLDLIPLIEGETDDPTSL